MKVKVMEFYFMSESESPTIERELQNYLIQHTNSIAKSPSAALSWKFIVKHTRTGRAPLFEGSSVRKCFLVLIQNPLPCNFLPLMLVLPFWDQTD